jgi:hypothetical protein
MPAERWTELLCHPSSRNRAVRGVATLVQRGARGVLDMSFRLDGDLSRLRVPAPSVPRIAQGLWEHTCFEAFVAIDHRSEYHEFNFAPSGEWAAHVFRRYRDGGPLADEALAPSIRLRATDRRLELQAHSGAPLRIGLAAVIEGNEGTLSYWALRHPPGKPDFHHADGFALRLEP